MANQDVNLTLRRGEVLALLGENGAGKTTLMNILYGLYHQDAGEMRVRGEVVRISSPSESIRRGIGMVHQHFMLVPVFTVAENIVLGSETVKGLALDLDRRLAMFLSATFLAGCQKKGRGHHRRRRARGPAGPRRRRHQRAPSERGERSRRSG